MSVRTSNRAYRIYVVEDSAILLRLLLDLLASLEDVCVVGHSGRADDAIEAIAGTAPDAVIVDLLLESGSGFDVLEALARVTAQPPMAIVLSNLAWTPYRERAARLGAAHFFDKSTEILHLFRLLSTLADEHRRGTGSDSNHD
jgi:two-component system LytT family response regulator